MTNKETLDLALTLGIDVKSHSSSVQDAQADRVRRRAEREGLVRDEQPEEPKAEKPVKKAAAKKSTGKPAKSTAPVAEPAVPVAVAAEPAAPVAAETPA